MEEGSPNFCSLHVPSGPQTSDQKSGQRGAGDERETARGVWNQWHKQDPNSSSPAQLIHLYSISVTGFCFLPPGIQPDHHLYWAFESVKYHSEPFTCVNSCKLCLWNIRGSKLKKRMPSQTKRKGPGDRMLPLVVKRSQYIEGRWNPETSLLMDKTEKSVP